MTSPIGAVSTTPATATAATTGTTTGTGSTPAKSGQLLDPEAFLRLLVAQLQYQDPSKPVDTAAFMNQTAMLSQVQTMNAMSDTLTSLTQAQQIQASADLIGKTVTYTNASGAKASGLVTGASVGSGAATVRIGGATVPLSSILEVTATTA